MELVELTPKVFNYYKRKVRSNRDITYDQARKKLTRNILLAKLIPPRSEDDVEKGNKLYAYGNLYILVRNNTVIQLKNYRGINAYTGWEFDAFKYVELTKQLGIIED